MSLPRMSRKIAFLWPTPICLKINALARKFHIHVHYCLLWIYWRKTMSLFKECTILTISILFSVHTNHISILHYFIRTQFAINCFFYVFRFRSHFPFCFVTPKRLHGLFSQGFKLGFLRKKTWSTKYNIYRLLVIT